MTIDACHMWTNSPVWRNGNFAKFNAGVFFTFIFWCIRFADTFNTSYFIDLHLLIFIVVARCCTTYRTFFTSFRLTFFWWHEYIGIDVWSYFCIHFMRFLRFFPDYLGKNIQNTEGISQEHVWTSTMRRLKRYIKKQIWQSPSGMSATARTVTFYFFFFFLLRIKVTVWKL